MQKRWIVLMVVAAVVVAMVTSAFALQCQGKIIFIGESKWEVQEACGEPSAIEETVEVVLQRAYDEIRHGYVHIPVSLNKSIWTYNFGSSRLIYILTFREGKLDKIETGGYGH